MLRLLRRALSSSADRRILSENLISCQELKSSLRGCKLLDCSWYMPVQKRDTFAEFKEKRLPEASYIGLDALSDPQNEFPHGFPPADIFAREVGARGILPSDDVVLYDTHGIFSAPRVWFLFKAYGHKNVRVLDGGLPNWVEHGFGLDSGKPAVSKGETYDVPSLLPDMLVSWQDMLRNVETREAIMVDARSPDRFFGRVDEPRSKVRAGHIPGAVNIPFSCLLFDHGIMKDPGSLRAIFEAEGITANSKVFVSCGSGVTACIVILALKEAFGSAVDCRLYDGSWTEWGSRNDLPVEQS